MRKYFIRIDSVEFEIKLKSTHTAQEIIKRLPLHGKCQKWGDEYYFYVNFKIQTDDSAKQIINLGEIAYWPAGNAIAIAFGETPISIRKEIKLVDKCNIWAEAKLDLKKLRNLVNPKLISVEVK